MWGGLCLRQPVNYFACTLVHRDGVDSRQHFSCLAIGQAGWHERPALCLPAGRSWGTPSRMHGHQHAHSIIAGLWTRAHPVPSSLRPKPHSLRQLLSPAAASVRPLESSSVSKRYRHGGGEHCGTPLGGSTGGAPPPCSAAAAGPCQAAGAAHYMHNTHRGSSKQQRQQWWRLPAAPHQPGAESKAG